MEQALHLPNPRRSLAITLAAALFGAGAATTTYALIDGDQASPRDVVVVKSPGGDSKAQPTPMSGPRP